MDYFYDLSDYASMHKDSSRDQSNSISSLPNFCQASTVYLLVIASVLLSLLLAFATLDWQLNFWYNLSLYSLFIVWTSLFSLALLCLIRRGLPKLSLQFFFFLAICIIVCITTLFSFLSSQYLSYEFSFWFLIRNSCIALIVSGIFFRFYFLQQDSLRRIQSEAEARVQALQSRIRPHFLFNSLNTLANLASQDPNKTENMILDMADIFRASMQRSDKLIPFVEEKNLCNQYLGLEQQRLGNKLTFEWLTDTIPDNLLVPPLLLQPLIENAVLHGVQARSEGGLIQIKGISLKNYIQIEITNPLPSQEPQLHKGNSMALSNIRQRLAVLYQGKASLNYHQSNEHFYCIVKLPKEL